MSFHRPRLGDSTFSGAPFNPRPGTLSPAVCQSPMATEPAKPTAAPDRQADLVCLSDIEDRPVDWLWQDRLASGTLAMLSGHPGSGKTWVALAIAAALSRGRVPSAPKRAFPVPGIGRCRKTASHRTNRRPKHLRRAGNKKFGHLGKTKDLAAPTKTGTPNV